jgi:hypothetical protein
VCPAMASRKGEKERGEESHRRSRGSFSHSCCHNNSTGS